MLATKNRAWVGLGLIALLSGLLAACAPPGPRALLHGRKLLDAGQYDEAARVLKSATLLMPTNAVAWNYLGLAYHRAGMATNAVFAYSRALTFNRELSEARFNLGCLWLEQNKFDAAKSEFTAFTLRQGKVPEGWLKLGLAQLGATNSQAAEKSFREAINLDPRSAEAWNALGLAQRQRGRAPEAAQSFTSALKQHSDFRPALLNLATISHQDLNNRADALRYYRAYLALQPRAADWEAVNALAQSLAPPTLPPALPQPHAPSNAVNRVAIASNLPTLANATKQPTAGNNARPTTLTKSEPTPAVAKPPPTSLVTTTPPPPPLMDPVKVTPETVVNHTRSNTPPAPAAVGDGVTNLAAIPAAKPERRSILTRLNPFKREARSGSSEGVTNNPGPVAAAADGVSTNSIRATDRYAYLSPPAPPAGNRIAAEQILMTGQQAQTIGRLAESIQAYRRAGQVDGSYFEAHYRLGLAAFEARSFRLALSAWETALALQPDSADARYNFALTLKASSYPADAANELERLLALHPDEARGHLTLGNLCAEQFRDIPRARRHYERVLQLDPRNPQAQSIRYWLVANPG